MFLTVEQVIELGLSRANIYRKMAAGEWASREVGTGRNGKSIRMLALASLPEEIQRRWLELTPPGGDPAPPPEKSTEVSAPPTNPLCPPRSHVCRLWLSSPKL